MLGSQQREGSLASKGAQEAKASRVFEGTWQGWSLTTRPATSLCLTGRSLNEPKALATTINKDLLPGNP